MSLTDAAALAICFASLAHGLTVLRFAYLQRRLTQAYGRWYRATISATRYGLPTPGRVGEWPGVAALEQRLERFRPFERAALALGFLGGVAFLLVAV